MASKTVCIGTDSNREPYIDSTKILNIIAADPAGVVNSTVDTELKQNFNFLVHDFRLNISPSGEVFRETHLSDYYGHGE